MASPYVRIKSVEAGRDMLLLMGDTPPTLSGGEGGFDETGRQRRKAFSEWSGHGLLKLDMALVIDGRVVDANGAASIRSVETTISSLTKVSRSPKAFARPPLCDIEGSAVPPQALDVESWVVTQLEWTGVPDRDDDGNRTRQDVTVTFTEFVEPELALSRAVLLTPKPGATYRLVPVAKYRDLAKFAAHYLKKASRWKEVATLNGIRGTKIPPKFYGKKLKVPLR